MFEIIKKFKSPLIFVSIIIIGTLVYVVIQHNRAPKTTDQEALELVTQLSKVIILPKEKPSLALVTDITQLKDQKFFQNAQNGDKLLIFINAKKAIIYRPATKQIVDIGPIVEK